MRNYLLIALYGIVLLIPFLNGDVVLTRHEVLASEPAREILEGNVPWSVQTFAGNFRVDKPPTMSWLIAGSMKIFGSRDEFVCRLPAAISGIIAAIAVGAIGTRLMNPTTGLLSGLILLTTFIVIKQARLAEADMPLTASVCVAMSALLLPRNIAVDSASRQRAIMHSLLFYGATGFGFMLKGIAPLVTIPAGLILIFWAKDPWAKKVLKNPIGIVLFLILLVAWPVSAYLTYPPIVQAWKTHLLDRAAGDLKDEDPITLPIYIQQFFYYFWMIPVLVFPATPAFVIGIWTGIDRWKSRVGQFLIAWAGPFLILLTFSAWKHLHYPLPIIPAFVIVAAYGTTVWMKSMKDQIVARNLLIAWFLGCAVVILYVEKKVLPKFDGYRVQADFAREVNRDLPLNHHATLLEMREAHLAFYLDQIPDRIDDVNQLPLDTSLHVITYRSVLDRLPARLECRVVSSLPKIRNLDNRADELVFVHLSPLPTTQPAGAN